MNRERQATPVLLRRSLLLAAWAVLAAAGAASASVYSDLVAELTRYPHRQPGSTNLEACFSATEAALRSAGLEPHYQTFDALAPRTQWCRLTIDGRPVEPVHPVNSTLIPVHTGGDLAGPLVWLGDGSLAAMAGKGIRGSIGVIDLTAPRVKVTEAFAQGARALILVGGEGLSQWQVATLCHPGSLMLPMVYVDAATAERLDLRGAGGRQAVLNVKVTLDDVVGRNLWVELPGESGAQFKFGSEEALVLSATLDTAGWVPDRCPQTRAAANAALLAEVACGLAGKTRKRSVLVVFFGSHAGAQEAARHFYYADALADLEPGDRDSLESRGRQYEAERAAVGRLLAACDRADIFVSREEEPHRLALRVKDKLVGAVNNLNTDLQGLRKANLALERQRRGVTTEAGRVAFEDAVRTNDARIAELADRKRQWNALRQQLTDRRLDDTPANLAAYGEALALVRDDLAARQAELTRLTAHVRTDRDLAARLKEHLVVAHFEFDFATARDPWLFNMMASYEFFFDKGLDPGSYLMHLAALGSVYRGVKDPAWPAPLLEEALNPYYKPYTLSVPVLRSAPTSVGLMLGITGYQLMTVGAPLDEDELPVAAPTDLAGLVPAMAAFAGAAADSPALSLRSPFPKARLEERLTYRWKGGDDYAGIRFVGYSKASSDTEGAPRRAVLAIRRDPGLTPLPGISRYPVTRINADGYVTAPLLNRAMVSGAEWQVTLFAFGFDPDGRVDRMPESTPGTTIDAPRRNLFYAHGGGAFSYGFAPELVPGLVKATTLNARTDSRDRIACGIRFPTTPQQYYTDKPGRIKVLGANGELLLGATAEAPAGAGVPLDRAALLGLDGIAQGAADYWLLNEVRLRALRDRNILNDALETLHAESREHLDEAAHARDSRDYNAARAHEVAASCLENRVYGPLRGITDDLVKAVVILLLINIPFAFALERLLFGFTSIYKQVLGFAGFFVGTFLVLFFTHPAFALASAPIVIFLAFVIILLSGITIAIVMGRIRQEIRAIQGLASTVHGAGGDSSPGMAAVLIGISGMRNRPLKTLLTALTVLLLTFTILVFASFTSELGVVGTYLGKGQDEDRIELHRFSYLAIADDLLGALETLYGGQCQVFRRGGMFRNPAQGGDRGLTALSPDRIFFNRANGRMAGVGAVFGLDPRETAVNARLRRLLPGFTNTTWAHPPVYLSEATAGKLGLAPGAEVLLLGRPFTFAGVFSGAGLQEMTTLDNTKIVPPDFESTVRNIEKNTGRGAAVQDLEEADAGSFGWFSPDRLAITDLGVLQTAWPQFTYVNFVTLQARSGETDLGRIARELAVLFRGSVHVKSSEGARKLFFTRAVTGSGFSDVIVPLLLGGLIIFSSLMGSIVDREREIFTYSALGLSPPDVGALFFAESAVYSVLGGMGGYLLGLVMTSVLTTLGSHGLIRAPSLNVSSLSSVLTILIVMGVVMLSTIYPAIKAGKSANPGVARKWKMPAPEGDLHRFVFPFTVSASDFAGILSFIREHFENHGDATLGNFAARNVKLFRVEDGTARHLGIRAEISLAPFDLGVFQEFRLYSKEFEIAGIEEVVVELERRSGAPGAWLRGNRVFVEEMRQQFLLWRSLPISTVEHYRRQTAETLQERAADV